MTISGTSSTPSTSGGTSVLGTQQAAYGQNDFLKLLTEQLKNQTPFEPVDSASFNNQLASYSNMETQGQLNDNLLKLLDFQGVIARSQGLSQGSALLGKDVDYVNDTGDTVTGKVNSVFVDENGNVQLRLEAGDTIDLRKVVGISVGDTSGDTTTTGTGTGTESGSGTETGPGTDSSSSGASTNA